MEQFFAISFIVSQRKLPQNILLVSVLTEYKLKIKTGVQLAKVTLEPLYNSSKNMNR